MEEDVTRLVFEPMFWCFLRTLTELALGNASYHTIIPYTRSIT